MDSARRFCSSINACGNDEEERGAAKAMAVASGREPPILDTRLVGSPRNGKMEDHINVDTTFISNYYSAASWQEVHLDNSRTEDARTTTARQIIIESR